MRSNFLRDVAAHVREELAAGTYGAGVPEARRRSPPSLREAIARDRGQGALLVEYKRASPGAAVPLPRPPSVEEFLQRTELAGVTAYSCLATGYGFDGSPARVHELASRTPAPVLFKEFVVAPEQVKVAARTGASAVLLIARLQSEGLLERPLAELAAESHRLGLEVLLELHSTAELSQTDGVAADVYGVNTRDLASLRFDRPAAYTTLDAARSRHLRPLLGLSGVEGAADAAELWSRGCDGLLVGSAVVRAAEPAAFLATLRRPAPGVRG